jgi:hypothetical protein
MAEQLAQVGEYRASHSHCPFCHQQLNTRPTYADQLLAEMNRE